MSAVADTEPVPVATSRDHLLAELDRVEMLLRRRAILLRDAGLVTDSDFRGLFVGDEHVDRVPLEALGRPEPPAAASLRRLAAEAAARNQAQALHSEPGGAARELRLPRLARLAGLGRLEVDTVLLAAGAQLDLRWERLLGYVQDDVTRRRPTLQLALDLLAHDRNERLAGRALLGGGPLIRDGLMSLVDEPAAERGRTPLPARALYLSERVLGHLLGSDEPDPCLAGCVEPVPPAGIELTGELKAAVAAVADGVPVVLHGRPAAGGREVAGAIAGRLGRAAICVDLRGAPGGDADELGWAVRREARLADAAVYLEAAGELPGELVLGLLGWFAGAGLPLIVRAGSPLADPHPYRRFSVHLAAPGIAGRGARWRRAALDAGVVFDAPAVDELAAKLSLDEPQTAAVLGDARRRAGSGEVRAADVEAAARAAAGGALGELAERLEPRYRLDDVVLPPRQFRALSELCARVRHWRQVHDAWGFPAVARGDGLAALFHGASGTGKTMAAEALATELGLELYRIDLAAVVSKYIGETEKNLRRVFAAAATVNGILLFDEADALFGRRSEVKDAHDRYANIETAYLLGKLESFSGLSVLTTNLLSNLDDAFTRRIQVSIEFPMPDGADRERLWKLSFPTGAPLAGDVDLRMLAQRIEISGAVIRNASLAAAFAAAEDGTAITSRHLVRAIAGELEKLGRPPSRGEFGELYPLIGGPHAGASR